jgi:hypothetical protein
MIRYFTLLFLLGFIQSFGQKNENKSAEKAFKKDISYLASDALEGRMTGSKGEEKARQYIASTFKEYKLIPKGDKNTYFQTFTFNSTMKYGKKNSLIIAGIKLTLDDEFYPIPYSLEGELLNTELVKYSPTMLDVMIKNQVLLLDLKAFKSKLSLNDLHNAKNKEVWEIAYDLLKSKNPKGIIFYHSDEKYDLRFYKKFTNISKDSSFLWTIKDSIADLLIASKAQLKVNGKVSFDREKITGTNVIGFIDNNAKNTIVIGAHYDHLGLSGGDDGRSLYKGEKEIHNGADDNASGTACMMELVRRVANNPIHKNSNYLFMAFSAEELGLLGSNYYTKNSTIDLSTVSAMINMDMVGRLDSLNKDLGINGTGTSPLWDSLVKSLPTMGMKIKTSSSGMGPSDQTSFYLKDIPAIHFFSGMHTDYHKPTDDESKINYQGMAVITDYIYSYLQLLDRHPKLIFTKTTTDSSQKTPAFKVTLGVIPDYFYDKKGLRLEGVSAGKTAEKAGLKAGDIITQMGDYKVEDINQYMQALSNFKKGEEVEISFLRENVIKKLKVKF